MSSPAEPENSEAAIELAEPIAEPVAEPEALVESAAEPAEPEALAEPTPKSAEPEALAEPVAESLANSPLIESPPAAANKAYHCAFDHTGCHGEHRGCLTNQIIKQEYELQHFVIDSTQIILNQAAVFQIHIITDSKTVYRTVSMSHDDYVLWVDDTYPYTYIRERIESIFRAE